MTDSMSWSVSFGDSGSEMLRPNVSAEFGFESGHLRSGAQPAGAQCAGGKLVYGRTASVHGGDRAATRRLRSGIRRLACLLTGPRRGGYPACHRGRAHRLADAHTIYDAGYLSPA